MDQRFEKLKGEQQKMIQLKGKLKAQKEIYCRIVKKL